MPTAATVAVPEDAVVTDAAVVEGVEESKEEEGPVTVSMEE